MQTHLNEEDENLIELELFCEKLIVQFKLVLELISRSKQKKPHLKQQFIQKKQSLFKLINDSNQLNNENDQILMVNNHKIVYLFYNGQIIELSDKQRFFLIAIAKC